MTTPSPLVYTALGQTGGGVLSADANTNITLAMEFTLSQLATLTGIWWWSPTGANHLPAQVGIFQSSNSALITSEVPTWSGTAGSGWVRTAFDGSIVLQPNVLYLVAVWSSSATNFYGAGTNIMTGFTTGIISTPVGGARFNVGGGSITFPGSNPASTGAYMVDVEVTTGLTSPPAPIQGFTLQSPRTWSTEDLVTTGRLRADMYNMAALHVQGRPIFFSEVEGGVNASAITFQTQNFLILNTWNVLLGQSATYYEPPLPGWYLIQGWGGQGASNPAITAFFSWGLNYVQGSLSTNVDLSRTTAPSGTAGNGCNIGNSGTDLVQFNTNAATGDLIGAYGFTTASGGSTIETKWGAEWVGLPSSGTVSGIPYTGPVGTVVTNPKPASLWPAGPGITLQGSVAAGGTALSLPPVPGLRAGQIIGLDWQAGQQSQPYAETATVSSIAGSVVNLTSGLAYGHNAGAAVAVPASAALLNEQVRDQNNFMFYPPLLRATSGTATQSIPNSTWTTLNLALSGLGMIAGSTIDNYSGFSSNAYTIPVSGLYLVAGQVYFTGTATSYAPGISVLVNGSVQYNGEIFASVNSSGPSGGVSATVRRLIRLTAGQKVTLAVFQNTGSNLSTAPSFSALSATVNLQNFCKFIVVFRAF